MKMHTQYANAAEGFKREACFTLDYSRDRLLHAAGQLTDEQVWSRPHPEMNAVGNILLHVSGNLRQWIVCGVGGEPDDRDRPAEFAQRQVIALDVLSEKLRNTVEEAKAAIVACSESGLLSMRTIQGFETTGLGAIFHSVSHLEGHAQETIYAARLILGDGYRFKDVY